MGRRRMQWVTAALAVGVALTASATAIAVNAATDVGTRWPLGLDTIRRHPFVWTVVLTVLGVALTLAVWWAQQRVSGDGAPPVPGPPPPGPPLAAHTSASAGPAGPAGPGDSDGPGIPVGPAEPVVEPVAVAAGAWVVDRHEEREQVVAALLRPGGAPTVGLTTALHGAGGFGKTTMAQLVCADDRIRRQFANQIYWITLGRDVREASAIAARVNDLITRITGQAATFTDPEQAGHRLGGVLDAGPRRLLVLDDVWHPEQLAPLRVGGGRCSRLVTTRNPRVLDGDGVLVRIDQMSAGQARALLTWNLPAMAGPVVEELLAGTGRWPLLLRLTNKILADAVRTGGDATAAGDQLCRRLRTAGPLTVDELTGEADRPLDVGDPRQRQLAVRATVAASADLLAPAAARRFRELAVFAEDEAVPVGLVAALWGATAGYDTLHARQVCARLADLALVSLDEAGGGTVALHDVLRDLLREQVGPALAGLHAALVDAVAATLPAATLPDAPGPDAAGPDAAGPHAAGSDAAGSDAAGSDAAGSDAAGSDAAGPDAAGPAVVAWWELDDRAGYLWDHLVEHLLGAGRTALAEAVAADLRWVSARLRRSGAPAPHADLLLVDTGRSRELAAVLARTAHLLAPTEPEHALVDILHTRAGQVPGWREQVTELRGSGERPRLLARWPLPDLPDPALRRVLSGHERNVSAVAAAPDGRWLATRDEDLVLRLWDTASWEPRTSLVAAAGLDRAIVHAPDGGWLLVGGPDRSVRIWDVARGEVAATLAGLTGWLAAACVAPDGRWLVTSGGGAGRSEHPASVWDVASGRRLCTLDGGGRPGGWSGSGPLSAFAVAPDGTWLAGATGGILSDEAGDEALLIWDTRTWALRATLSAGRTGVSTLTVAPDGSWLAAGGADIRIRARYTDGCREHVIGGPDKDVRIIDTATWRVRAILPGQGHLRAWSRVAPDGSWLATAGPDRHTVRIWNTRDWSLRLVLGGGDPAGDNPASGGGAGDNPVGGGGAGAGREPGAGTEPGGGDGSGAERVEVAAVAVAPDGRSLLVGGSDGGLRRWDTCTGDLLGVHGGHTYGVVAVAAGPDGDWVAAVGGDRAVRVWDAAPRPEAAHGGERRCTGGERGAGLGEVKVIAVAPDGRWLAVAGRESTRTKIIEVATDRTTATLEGHERQVGAAAVAPDGRWLATAGQSDRVHVWAVAGEGFRSVRTLAPTGYAALAACPDGSWLAVTGRGHTVEIWDAGTWVQRAVLTGHDSDVMALAVSPDGRWLASSGGGDHTVRIWDTSTWQARRTLTGWDGAAMTLVFSADGAWLATAGYDRAGIRIWETDSGRLRELLGAHDAAVFSMALHPGGRWLASVGWDRAVRVWDTTAWVPGALMRVANTVDACAWLPSGDGLVVGGRDGIFMFDFVDVESEGESEGESKGGGEGESKGGGEGRAHRPASGRERPAGR